MSETRRGIGAAGIALLAVACCAGLPLLVAASLSVAAFAVIGGITAGVVALVVVIALVALRARARRAGGPLVEVLYFDGCPNHQRALALVERVSRQLGLDPEIRLVNVPDLKAAQRMCFLGSPTIRIGGRDVDPHAEQRSDYALSCRVFRTDAGIAGQPDERWVREALLRDAGVRA